MWECTLFSHVVLSNLINMLMSHLHTKKFGLQEQQRSNEKILTWSHGHNRKDFTERHGKWEV